MKYTSRAALLTLLVIFSASGSAQAQVQPGAIPEFIPSSPWVVGESGLGEVRGLKGVKLPCMMANQFDNGFVVRLAGGGGQLTALAVDFRQNIFAPGQRYPAALYTDNGFRGTVQGSAFNASTLIFNLRDAGDVYGALKASRLLGISMGQNDMRFSMNNVSQGIDNLENCFGGGSAATQQAGAPIPVGQPLPDFSQTPGTLAEIQHGDAGREVYIKRGEAGTHAAPARMNASAAMKSTGAQPSKAPMGAAMGSWNAKAGENLQQVLSRWSGTAGVELQWQASNGGGQVAQDFNHSGSFNDAVAALLAENAAASGLQGRYDAGAAGPRANGPSYVADAPPVAMEPRTSAADPTSAYAQGTGGRGGQWKAPKGGSLQSVLQQWAAQSNVEVLWYATGGYPIKDDINQGGTFESALQTVLQTYENDNNRPVARLNTDPLSGRKVLVVESDRTL